MNQLSVWPYSLKTGDIIGARATSQNAMGWGKSSTIGLRSARMVEVGPEMEPPRGIYKEVEREIGGNERLISLEWIGAPGSRDTRFTYEVYWN